MSKNKVFCLGMSRTGTKSFAVGMEKLGYKALHNGGMPLTLQQLNEYEAFSDTNTCMFYYKDLYSRYPDAKFVLSYRDPKEWANKIVNWYNPRHKISYIHWHLKNEYISTKDTEEELADFCQWQYDTAVDFFSDKKDSFITHSVFKGETFQPIAEFLGVELKEDFSVYLKDESVKNNSYANLR